MKEKIIKNWKNIALVLLLLFSLTKCTQSCNRGMKVTAHEASIATLDSTVRALEQDTLEKAHQIAILHERVNTANANVETARSQAETARANEATANARTEAANANARAARSQAEAEKLRNQQK